MPRTSTIKAYNKDAGTWKKTLHDPNSISYITHRFLEKPGIYRLLPDLKNKTILCIGCGSGEECDYLMKNGAKKVVGIDNSAELIKMAKSSYPDIEFHLMDMTKLQFPAETFDIVYSSLTFHYIKSWNNLLDSIYKLLKQRGILLFSVSHPNVHNALTTKTETEKSRILGYSYKRNSQDKDLHVFGDYFNTKQIPGYWDNGIKVSFYPRPISDMVNSLCETGFTITRMSEPQPQAAAKKYDKRFYETYIKIPLFVVFSAQKQ